MLHKKNNKMKKRQNLCFVELTRLSRSCHWHDISRAFCRIPTFFLEIRTEKQIAFSFPNPREPKWRETFSDFAI